MTEPSDIDIRRAVLARVRREVGAAGRNVRIVDGWREHEPSLGEITRIRAAMVGNTKVTGDGYADDFAGFTPYVEAVINGLTVRCYGTTAYGALRDATHPAKPTVCSACGRSGFDGFDSCAACDTGAPLCRDCQHVCAVCDAVCCADHTHSDGNADYCPRHRCTDIDCEACAEYAKEKDHE